jgi:DNA-binding CsgD family transcriptional regulator
VISEARASDNSATFDELREPPPPHLTPRETEVLVQISDGLSNKEIARRLEISLHTVKFHIESLLRKLGARSRAEAVAKGLVRREV